MRIAICYWGICRSTDKTIDSIKKCIYEPLKKAGYEYDVFLHTYSIKTIYTNSRAAEDNLVINNDLYKLLNPLVFKIDDPADLCIDLQEYRTMGDPWGASFSNTTFNNHIYSLYSLNEVTNLWRKSLNQYDFVIYARPDVSYLNPINVDWMTALNIDECLLPDFHRYPINDRFAILRAETAHIYGSRFVHALDYSKMHALHSEKFLYHILMSNNICMSDVRFRFRRVRATGIEIDNDVKP